ncbi:hypothetical protein NXW37_29585 [Bacteroides thetaiotaomicron]|nr:hypothetical protein [Bacteroides thetaiotaomicron]
MRISFSGAYPFQYERLFKDSLMDHNTAAVCGTWWRADINETELQRLRYIEVNGELKFEMMFIKAEVDRWNTSFMLIRQDRRMNILLIS